jgi:Ras family protein
MKTRKIVVLGGTAVGKSSLIVQFVENHFAETYYPTIESTFTKVFKYKGQEYSTEIVDTAGQDEFSMLTSKHAVGIHGYVLVYSVTSKQSFEVIKVIRDKILNYTGLNTIPLVIVGNKVDLHAQRQISIADGEKLAKEWNCGFVEVSAKLNQNIPKIFDLILDQINKQSGEAVEKAECLIL